MTRLQFKYFIIYLFFPVILYSQTIETINVNGNKAFGDEVYSSWIRLLKTPEKIKPEALRDSIAKRISRNLAAEGFYNFSIDSIYFSPVKNSSKLNVNIILTEGEPTFIKSISFIDSLTGEDSVNVLPIFESLNDKIFSKPIVEQSISKTLRYYEESGYPFTTVKIYSVRFSFDSLSRKHFADITFQIKKNMLSKIDKIEIEGNTKTKPEVIIRNLRIERGELYSEKKISEIPRKLSRLQFFEKVEKPKYYLNSKKEGILLIKVEEKQTNFFDGILGYVPETETNGKGYFTGFVNVNLRNLFGTGRAFYVKWLQENRFSQELELKYLEPWIFNYPFNVQIGLYQRKQDTTYIKRKISGSFEYLTTEEISASFFLVSESTIPIIGNDNKFTVFNSNSVSTGIELRIDTRNNPLSPKSGVLFLNSYSYSLKRINGPEKFLTPQTQTEIGLQRLELDFSIYYEVFKNQVVQFSIHGKELRGSSFEVSDLYQFGGTHSLRGYREKQFSANRLLWSNFEYRYLLSEFSYAFLFFDAGYYLKSGNETTNTNEVSDILKSFGLGFSLESALGILNISYAVPQGTSISKGLIHFGILNNF